MDSNMIQHPYLDAKVIKQLCLNVKTTSDDFYSKKCLKRYLNTFAFDIGCNIPTDQQIKLLYGAVQDKISSKILKCDFEMFVKSCLQIYIESQRKPIGGIYQRLLIKLKNGKFNKNFIDQEGQIQ